MVKNQCIYILGVRVDLVKLPELCAIIKEWIITKSYSNYIVLFNANDAIISKHDRRVKEATNNSSLTVADGISIVLAARLYGVKLENRVYGPDLMLQFLKISEDNGYTNFFYGTNFQTLSLLTKNLYQRFPNLKISGVYAPPYRDLTETEEGGIVEYINNIAPDVVWIGLGCPKQQLWMYKHQHQLKVQVMIGVGAAFDFLAGTKLQAPRWLRERGLEWIFRLVTEPKRLWRRYLVNGSQFVYYFLIELMVRLLKLSR